MWKFQDFCITQILCEIIFLDCRSAKSAILPHLEALNFDCYEFLHFVLDGRYLPNEQNSQPQKWQKLHLLHF